MVGEPVKRFLGFCFWAIILWPVFTACKDKPTGTPLSFGIMAQGDLDPDGTSFPGNYSELFAIQSLNDIEQVANWLPTDVQIQLETVDYNSQFAVVVFQGEQQHTGYSVQVTEVSYLENTVNVFVNLVIPGEGNDVDTAITSPYQVVWVDMPENGNPFVAFNLVVNE